MNDSTALPVTPTSEINSQMTELVLCQIELCEIMGQIRMFKEEGSIGAEHADELLKRIDCTFKEIREVARFKEAIKPANRCQAALLDTILVRAAESLKVLMDEFESQLAAEIAALGG
jgi:cob(I)alamin adenosyltransferase